MASSLPSLYGFGRFTARRKLCMPHLRARAQSSPEEEGKPSSISIVDANMGLLKERLEMVRMEERLERWRRAGQGWNYPSGYDSCKLSRRGNKVGETLEVAELMVGTLGLTILGCTLCLCFVYRLYFIWVNEGLH